MAKLAFVDKTGCLHSTAWTCSKEGHDVIYWIEDKEYQKIGDGLVKKVNSEQEIVDFHPDIVYVYQDPRRVSSLTGKNLVAYGSTPLASKLEDERFYAAILAQKYGIKTPRTFQFSTISEVNDFLDSSDGRTRKGWVFKVNGKASSTHITESDDHLRAIIDFEKNSKNFESFILQERIDGIEVSIEGWFDYRLSPPGGPWIQPFNSTIERKRLLPGNVGPMTGCMYSVVWAWPGLHPKLFRQTLEKMTPHLLKIKYTGPIDGNFIIDYMTHTPHFLEWTPRLGWNAFEAFMYGLSQPSTVGEFLVKLGTGVLHKYRLSNDYLGVVRLYAPATPDIPILAPYMYDRRLFPIFVYLDDMKQLRTVGNECTKGLTVIMEAASGSSSIKELARELYEDLIPQITTIDLTYRNDLDKVEDDIKYLEEWGYITKREPSVPSYKMEEPSWISDSEGGADQDVPSSSPQPSVSDSVSTGLV